jgi:2-polyprenyl-6-methoxyphenol hydroxylase-like FAD-dependent oxidoreductase
MPAGRNHRSQRQITFKAIIIDARVTGLTVAHCLAKTSMDYVLLDKGVVAPSFGTTNTLQPHGCRTLHQLGCLDTILAACDVMGGAQCRDPSDKSFASNDFFVVVKRLYVIPSIFSLHILFLVW